VKIIDIITSRLLLIFPEMYVKFPEIFPTIDVTVQMPCHQHQHVKVISVGLFSLLTYYELWVVIDRCPRSDKLRVAQSVGAE